MHLKPVGCTLAHQYLSCAKTKTYFCDMSPPFDLWTRLALFSILDIVSTNPMKTPKSITCQSFSEYFLTTSLFVTPISMEKLKSETESFVYKRLSYFLKYPDTLVFCKRHSHSGKRCISCSVSVPVFIVMKQHNLVFQLKEKVKTNSCYTENTC